MISALPFPVKRFSLNKWMVMSILFYSVLVWYALGDHIIWQSVNVWIGLMVLPIVTTIRTKRTGSYRYGWMSMAVALCCMLVPVKTLLYLSIVMALLFVVETFKGRTNLLTLLVIGMMSPIFQYVANVFSFPVRLWLTTVAGKVMNGLSMGVQVQGNMISYHGAEFSVDPACMGLNMLITCLLLQLMLVAVSQKKYQLQLSGWTVAGLLAGTTLLNVIANLTRIILLISFRLMPGTVMHEVAGIMCFVVYVIVPAVVLTRWITKRFGTPALPSEGPMKIRTSVAASAVHTGSSMLWVVLSRYKQVTIHLLVAVLLAYASWVVVQRDNIRHMPGATLPAVEGYTGQWIYGDVIKLETQDALLYIKSIDGFYSSDHNPSICWRGSGYAFTRVEATEVHGLPVFTATLEKGEDRLYTAWWYDNGAKQTINQFTWRWDALCNGSQYSLINLSAESKEVLEQKIGELKSRQLLKPVLH